MNTINLDKECGCFKKSEFENNMSFESKDEALMQAQIMVNHMNSEFCQKHEFSLTENKDEFNISRFDKGASSGCCGGGHCS